MRTAAITAFNGPDSIEIQEQPEPLPGRNQVLVDVEYAGVTFPDVLQTRGEYQLRPELPFAPGYEVSGRVRSAVSGFAAGTRVAGISVVGGFAETVAIDANLVFPLPDDVPFDQAAALPLNYLTVHFALKRRAKLEAGETVLVHGAAGGIGTAACQLAAALGARVIGVVSTPEKERMARAAGAHETVSAADFRNEVRLLTGGRGVDVIVDPVGGDRFTDSLRSLAVEGRLLVLGFTGRDIPTVKVTRLLLTNTSVVGVAAKELWDREPSFAGKQWRELVPLIESGLIRPPVSSVYPLNQAATAIRVLDERRAVGRVLIDVQSRPL